jgi:hypothetical protein
MLKKRILREKIIVRLNKSNKIAFILSEFLDLSGRDQVGRVLRYLVKEGILIKIGRGVFAKAVRSPISQKVILADSFQEVAKEALAKLKVKTYPTFSEQEYNSGLSTQVPTGLMIGVKGRISRVLSYNGRRIKYERIAG